jgi:biotin-dependent carboxylase-like uncharacterized protein
MIEVLATPGLATVQDLGRFGSMRHGVGTAGAMDRMALAGANLLLGNEEGAAAIEIPLFPFVARLEAACSFALTGGGCSARLDRRPLLPWSVHAAEPGQQLVLSPSQGRTRGSRAYLALSGGIDVPEVLGSRSTQLRGGFGGQCGRAIEPGDRFTGLDDGAALAEFGLLPPAAVLPLEADGLPAVRVIPAAEYACFTAAARDAFWAGTWKITAQSDRYGYRLAGEALAFEAPVEMLSHGIVPGVIQVPPSGQPIIQMRDAQPSGGYPKIGTVIEADLWRLGQAPAGSRIRFVETGWEGAVMAAAEARAWLDEAARLAALVRSSPMGQRT